MDGPRRLAPHVEAALSRAGLQPARPGAPPPPGTFPRILAPPVQARPASPPGFARPVAPHVQAALAAVQPSFGARTSPPSSPLVAGRPLAPHVAAAVSAIQAKPAALRVSGVAQLSKEKSEESHQTTTDKNLYAVTGDSDGPYPRKNKDCVVDGEDVIPQTPAKGLSVWGDLKVSASFLSGNVFLLSKGTDLPDGLAVVADGKDVGGSHAKSHHSIYPTKVMKYSEFKNKVKKKIPWKNVGTISGKEEGPKEAAKIMKENL